MMATTINGTGGRPLSWDHTHPRWMLKTSTRDNEAISGGEGGLSSWRDWALSCVYGACMIAQIGLTIINYNIMGLAMVANLGWLVMTISAFFGWLPIYTFKRKGAVPEGKSYMRTTVLVDSGIYSIVRHPQFLAGVLISLALVLMSQYWVNAVLFLPVLVGTILDARRADVRLVEKFGEDYLRYMVEVPGLNLLVGIIRLFSK